MITLMVIAVDRYFVITRPLASIGVLSQKRAVLILLGAWAYSLGWSLPPFFGWSKCAQPTHFNYVALDNILVMSPAPYQGAGTHSY